MNQYILVFPGFGRVAGRCHVVVASNERGETAVLVGELDDNPGTTVTNAIEQVAENIRRELLDGDATFELYEYVPKGLPKLEPTFYRIQWGGQPGCFVEPAWLVVEPESDPWLRELGDAVMQGGYTSQNLIDDRELMVIDARTREDLPAAS